MRGAWLASECQITDITEIVMNVSTVAEWHLNTTLCVGCVLNSTMRVGCVPRLEATALAPESLVYILCTVYLGTHGTRMIFLLMNSLTL